MVTATLITPCLTPAPARQRSGICLELHSLEGLFGPTIAGGYELIGTADFNKDGSPDYVLYNSNTRQTALWYLSDNIFLGGLYGPILPAGWSLVAP